MALRIGLISESQITEAMRDLVKDEHDRAELALVRLGFVSEENRRVLASLVDAVIRNRLEEVVGCAEREADTLATRYGRDRHDLRRFEDLFYARTQLCLALRSMGKVAEAREIEVANQDQLHQLLESLTRAGEARDDLSSLTLHHGFSLEDAERLLEAHVREHESGIRPCGVADEVTYTFDEPRAPEMPLSIDFANRYSLVAVLGQGGLGIVYRAKDNLLPREVALKIKRAGAGGESARHILRESAIIAMLDHPNIIPVYCSGYRADRESPFFVMKLVEGRSWKELSSKGAPGQCRDQDRRTWLLRGFAEICEAVQHAHDRGVIHGDPKPANVIVDVEHRPWLLDWGLSRVIEPTRLQGSARMWFQQANSDLRDLVLEPMVKGQLVGTLIYMSPEQALGEGVSQKTDIYVLGASLFELLTGEPAFSTEGGSFVGVLKRVAAGEHRKPREVDPAIPPRLEEICLKAMARIPDQRYASAAELAKDIRFWLT
jgi:hypothetical protein